MKLSRELAAFQDRLGHRFADPDLLRRALTHPSVEARPDNQRLEFLGDRVLGLAMAEALYTADAQATEGQLAPRFNALVRKETCADVAAGIGLGEVMRLGRAEMRSGGRRKQALLGDAMEAVIAAIYRDAGFDAARAAVLRLWGNRVDSVEDDARDPKTALQEWSQAQGLGLPDYVELKRDGPDHAPQFTIEVRLSDGRKGKALATSKRAAEQQAALALLNRIGADK